MEFNKKRGHFLIIFERLIEIPLIIGALVLTYLLSKEFDTNSIILLVVILLSPIKRFLNFISTRYTINKDFLVIETGILTKRKIEIPKKTITTVDFSQNILFQLFHVNKIQVENSASTAENRETNITLAFKEEQAILFKEALLSKKEIKQKEIPQENIIKINKTDFLKYGLLQSKLAYVLTIISFSITASVMFFNDDQISKLFSTGTKIFGTINLIIYGIILIYILSIIVACFKALITYYNFSITNEKKKIIIEYGLINKKKYLIQKDKISGVVLKQSILMKKLKIYSLEAAVIGYKDNETSNFQSFLCPIGDIEKLNQVLKNLDLNFDINLKETKSEKKALKYYFYNFYFIASIIAIIIGLFISNNYLIFIALFFLIYNFIGIFLKYFNSGIASNKNFVKLCYGTYTKVTAVFYSKRIESVSSSGSFLKLKNKTNSIIINLFAPLYYRRINVLNVPTKEFDKLETNLNY